MSISVWARLRALEDEVRLLRRGAVPSSEQEWSSLSREAGDRFDLSLWKKGGSCVHCASPAVFARAFGEPRSFEPGRFLLVCKSHAEIKASGQSRVDEAEDG